MPEEFSTFQSSQISTAPVGLIKASQLLKESWRVFRQLFWKSIAVYVITFISGLPLLLAARISSSINIWLFVFLIVLSAVIFIVAAIMSGLALIFLAKERNRLVPSFRQNIKNAYAFSWHNLYSFLWLNALIGAIVLIGFFLLFVPGIIFVIWFAFPVYILAYENIKGIKALQYSKELVRGYWGKVFWRKIAMFLAILAVILPLALLSFINNSFIKSDFTKELLEIIIDIISMLVGLFAVIYAVLLYEGLKNFKGEINIEGKKKVWYVVGAVAGLAVIPLLIGATIWLAAISTTNKISDNIFLGKDAGYYQDLFTECKSKNSPNCCDSSVVEMAIGKYRIEPAEGCPIGSQRNMLKCEDSFVWCEPVQ